MPSLRVINHLENLVEEALEELVPEREIMYDVTLEFIDDRPVYTFALIYDPEMPIVHTAVFPTLVPSAEFVLEWVRDSIRVYDSQVKDVQMRLAGSQHLN